MLIFVSRSVGDLAPAPLPYVVQAHHAFLGRTSFVIECFLPLSLPRVKGQREEKKRVPSGRANDDPSKGYSIHCLEGVLVGGYERRLRKVQDSSTNKYYRRCVVRYPINVCCFRYRLLAWWNRRAFVSFIAPSFAATIGILFVPLKVT
ncbi:unnamed protein product, partial [Ectocarpus sp. 13 AM-2016]